MKRPFCFLIIASVIAVSVSEADTAVVPSVDLRVQLLDDEQRSCVDNIYRRVNMSVPDAEAIDMHRTMFEATGAKDPDTGYSCEKPIRSAFRYADMTIPFALDSSDLEAKGYDRLFIDLDLNGEFSSEEIIQGVPEPEPPSTVAVNRMSSGYQTRFEGIRLTKPDEGSVSLPFILRLEDEEIEGVSYSFTPLFYHEANLTIDGNSAQFIILDHTRNGQWEPLDANENEHFYAESMNNDSILLSPKWNSDTGMFDYQEISNGERAFAVGDKWLWLEPEKDLTSIKVTELETGFLQNPNLNENEAFEITLTREEREARVQGTGTGKVTAPVGQWDHWLYTIRNTEDATNKKGETAVSAYYDPDNVSPLVIEKDKLTRFAFGLPLKIVTSAEADYSGNIKLDMSIEGPEGGKCYSLSINGERPPKPKVTIANEQGKIIERGTLEYG